MIICFLAPANSIHIKKLSAYFISKHYEVHIVSLTNADIPGVVVHYIDSGASAKDSDFSKSKYIRCIGIIKKTISLICPNIISVHYASSYGLLAALSGIKNYSLYVWGSDIFEFPRKSILHKMLLKFSLRKANTILSTSKYMAIETKKYTNKKIQVAPFGVDVELFSNRNRNRNNDNDFIVGNIKSLEDVYGIDIFIKSISYIVRKRPDINIKIKIGGKGSREIYYKELSRELNIEKKIEWLGFIPQNEVAKEWANMDLAVINSLSESFGVASLEAQACGVPVIISNIDGLKETSIKNVTSIVLEKNSPEVIADTIIKLYDEKKLRRDMSFKAREFVINNFEIIKCSKVIEKLLISCINIKNN